MMIVSNRLIDRCRNESGPHIKAEAAIIWALGVYICFNWNRGEHSRITHTFTESRVAHQTRVPPNPASHPIPNTLTALIPYK